MLTVNFRLIWNFPFKNETKSFVQIWILEYSCHNIVNIRGFFLKLRRKCTMLYEDLSIEQSTSLKKWCFSFFVFLSFIFCQLKWTVIINKWFMCHFLKILISSCCSYSRCPSKTNILWYLCIYGMYIFKESVKKKVKNLVLFL